MVGSGLKKYAAELGLRESLGVAYGVHNGYMMTLQEGAGWKSIGFAVSFGDDASKVAVQAMLLDADYQKARRIGEYSVTDAAVYIKLVDSMGTMKILREVVDEMIAKFTEAGVRGVTHCQCCGGELAEDGVNVLINGVVYRMHPQCIDKVEHEQSENAEMLKSTGSVASGTVGAVIGGIIGAIPWAVASYFGWFVGWLGFLIGIAAKKGYELMKGKETKAKAVVIIITVVLAVIAAEYVSLLTGLCSYLATDAEFAGESYSVLQVAQLLNYTLLTSSEYLTSVLIDVALGLVFAGLGVFQTIKSIFVSGNEATSKPVRLP